MDWAFLLDDVRPVREARLVQVESDSLPALWQRSVREQAVHVAVAWNELRLRPGFRVVPIDGLVPCPQWVTRRRTDRRGPVRALAEALAALAAAETVDHRRGLLHRIAGNGAPV
ncbi:hypothetical protein [Geodermatophilus saharensis]|uniref:hypothetical protein n=1 Tax=Geodermatophilus saharensis TaxID=1137994 RepID=UPI00114060FA|nr:hypothetical protein [Geodermatophilus saharensis]